ncbi:MAG: hypothetical protein ABJA78_15740 [Ferruginibacter sp.]
MKRISIALALSIFSFFCNAQAIKTSNIIAVKTGTQAMKVTTYTSKKVANYGGQTFGHEVGVPASVIPQDEFGGAIVYWKLDVMNFKAIKAKYRLDMKVMQVVEGQETISYKLETFIPTKNGYTFAYSQFKEGTYNIYVTDQDNPEDIYCKTTFTVPAIPKPDYKHNSTLVVCKSVDDNWNPVGATTKIKAGECMNFLFKAKDRVPGMVMIWNVVKVNKDGNEEYVNALDQGTTGKPFRYLATTEGVCSFNSPGKYRVYIFIKDDYDTGIQRGEDSKYMQKTEITVE